VVLGWWLRCVAAGPRGGTGFRPASRRHRAEAVFRHFDPCCKLAVRARRGHATILVDDRAVYGNDHEPWSALTQSANLHTHYAMASCLTRPSTLLVTSSSVLHARIIDLCGAGGSAGAKKIAFLAPASIYNTRVQQKKKPKSSAPCRINRPLGIVAKRPTHASSIRNNNLRRSFIRTWCKHTMTPITPSACPALRQDNHQTTCKLGSHRRLVPAARRPKTAPTPAGVRFRQRVFLPLNPDRGSISAMQIQKNSSSTSRVSDYTNITTHAAHVRDRRQDSIH